MLLRTIEIVCLRQPGGNPSRGPEKSEHCLAFLVIVEKHQTFRVCPVINMGLRVV